METNRQNIGGRVVVVMRNNSALQIKTLRDYLARCPVAKLIQSVSWKVKPNGRVSCNIVFSDPVEAKNILINSSQFINANLGYLHNSELGDFSFDFRSRTKGIDRLGDKSLQINIGKTNGKARADIDLFNPAEDLPGLIGHAGEVLNSFLSA